MYDAAIAMVRKGLKVPNSARFATVTISNDTVKIAVKDDTLASISGWYEAQNLMGVFLPGGFRVELAKRNGKWVNRFENDWQLPDLD